MKERQLHALKWMMMVAVVGVGCTAAATYAGEDDKATALCPVMDEPVDPSLWIPTDEGPVLFCCGKCVGKYKESPERYAEATAKMREALAKMPKVQVNCPLSGDPVDRDVSVDHNGEKVYFCCGNCKARFTADPDKYKAELANSYSYQTRCPFSNDSIDPTAFVEFEGGQMVYFCCTRCSGKYASDPAGHNGKLQAMGIYANPKNLKKEG